MTNKKLIRNNKRNAAAVEAAEGEERAPGSAEGEPSKKLARGRR
jgi:hypothetical protein